MKCMDCGTPVYLNFNSDVVENDGGAIHAARCELVRQLVAERERREAADQSWRGLDRQFRELSGSYMSALAAQKQAEERAAGLEREFQDLKSCMDQDESDDRLTRHPNADAMMRESLGQEMFNRLWGPELEALGKVVDVALNREAAALAAQKQAEERAEQLTRLLWRAVSDLENVASDDGVKRWSPQSTCAHTASTIRATLAPQPADEREPCKTCSGRGDVVVETTMIGELRGQCPRCKATGLEPADERGEERSK